MSAIAFADSNVSSLVEEDVSKASSVSEGPPLRVPLRRYAELSIESLDLAMIVFDIEDTFGIEIPYNANEEVEDFKTVGSVVDKVKTLIAQSGGAEAAKA